MPVFFHNSNFNYKLKNKQSLKSWVKSIIEGTGYKLGDINYIFTSEEEILRINNEYLKHNFYTDIITFPFSHDKVISGDLYISIPTVQYNANKFNQSFELELNRVIAHGVLHLVGFDDKTKEEQKLMREQEELWLAKLIH